MLNENLTPDNISSADLEQEVMKRFREQIGTIPIECKISRQTWGCSTILCLDFQDCPNLLTITREQAPQLVMVARDLALASSLIFRIGNKVMGWTKPLKFYDPQ